MQFQVPQFIEVEDRIFGPLTIRQFIYIAGGAGLCYLAYHFVPIFIFKILAVAIIGGFSAMLAFFKYNNRPFIFFIESAFMYFVNGRLYIWHKDIKPREVEEKAADAPQQVKLAVPKLSESKLHDLAWSLDINESQNPITAEDGRTNAR